MARLTIGYPSTHGDHPVPRHRPPFLQAPRLRAQLVQLQTTLSQQMNKPALKPLGSALRQNATQKSGSPPLNGTFRSSFLKASPHLLSDRAVLLSQSAPHTGALVVQPGSEAYEAEDRFFRVGVARRLMSPHPAVADPSGVALACPNKGAVRQICAKPVDAQQHHCYGCRYGGGVDRRHAAVDRCDTITQWHQGVRRAGDSCSYSCGERTSGTRAHGPRFQSQWLHHVPRCCRCVSFLWQPGPHCSSQHPPRSHGQES